jgi:hypothetical protein
VTETHYLFHIPAAAQPTAGLRAFEILDKELFIGCRTILLVL